MSTSKYRIGIVFGTRPEAIKMAPLVQKFQQNCNYETRVILTGQHREMVQQVMQLFEIKADRNLEIMQHQQTLTDITYRSLQGLGNIFEQIKPDMVLVQGDTTTAFAAALAAFYQKIPIGHVEAGLRTNDLFNPYPEEANRRLISQLTKLHFAPTEKAVENLIKAGVVGKIYQTGNTVIDALLSVAKTQPKLDIPNLNLEKHRLILATVHRRENWGEPLEGIAEGFLKTLDQYADTMILLPLHRNPTVREPLQTMLGGHPRVILTEPLDYSQLVAAIADAYLVLTDSGGLQEEAPSLGKPVLVLRKTTERPEAIAAGTAKLIGTDPQDILRATSELLGDPEAYQKMATAINPFGDGHAASRIIQHIDEYFKSA